MTTVKGQRATIQVGELSLEVVMLPDGSYVMGMNQLKTQLKIQSSDKTGKKHVQPILKANSSRLTSVNLGERSPNLKAYPLDVLLEVIVNYSNLGNDPCRNLVNALAIESLERRADSAFGKSRTEEERNHRLSLRMTIRKDFRAQLTDHLQAQGATESHHYINAVVALNKAVGTHGKKRDQYDPDELAKMEQAQKFIGRRMEKGVGFYEALNDYREMLG